MADISLSLNNIQNIKTVNIEGVGVLKVRRLGAGEELDLSAKLRRLVKVIEELNKIDFTSLDATNPEDFKKISQLTTKAEALSEEATEIKKFEFETYKRCLSDDDGGKVVDVIMNTLTESERAELFNQIFGDKKPVDAPDTVQPDEEATDE